MALAVILVCLFPVRGFGLDPEKNFRQYVLRSWTSEQGLPQNSIRAMLQTRDGFLWIGTQGGVARFDGTGFVAYKAGAPDSIPNDSITGLAEDRDGSIWISSAGGLTRFDNGHFHNYSSRDGLPDNSIWRISTDPAGGVWAVTWRSELFHFDGNTVRRCGNPAAERIQDVNALLEDPKGTLWIATFHGLLARDHDSDFKRYTRQDGLAGDRVYALALDRQGELWAAGDGGLTHHASDHFSSVPIPGLVTATLLALDPNGGDDAIWTGSTGQGMFRLNARGVQRMGVAEGLTSDELYMLYFSRDGSLWLGALNGLNQLSDGAVTSYSTGEGLPNSTLDMQRSQGPNDELWFGRGKALFHVRDGTLVHLGLESSAARRSEAARDPLREQRAISIWVRSTSRSSRGLVLTDHLGNAVLNDGTQEQPLPHIRWASVGSMLIAHDGMTWVSGSEIGVLAYPTHGPPHSYTTMNGLDDNNVLAMAEDIAGNVWVGTISGLNRIHNGIVTQVFSCENITSIYPSADGSLWVSSGSGLIYVPPTLTPVRVFTQRDNLPTDVIEGIVEDVQGYLWLGTQQGIVRISKVDLLAPGSRAQGTPVVFGLGDGFRNAQVRINSVSRSRNGSIWFVTLQELAAIDPRRIQARPLAPIVIDQIDIDDQAASLSSISPLSVPAGRHRLTIRYTLPEFRIPRRIRFRYRLEGWDKNWIEGSTLRDATYTGIPPGRYTFRVANSDGYGKWSAAESTLPVEVVPYFYQTGWFLTLVSLLVATSIWKLHKLRVAQVSSRINAGLHERLQERTRIARELHDTLLQGMLGVSMQMYAASQQVSVPESISSMLGHTSQRLRDIAEQSRKAVEDLRSPSTIPDPLETRLSLAFADLNLPADAKPIISSVGKRKDLRPLVQIEVEQVAREAIANAVQHSGANVIRLDIIYQPAHFFVSVSDNGCGIDQRTQKLGRQGHWGITGMRERAESIGGSLRILPNVPRGTVVEISLRGTMAYIKPPRKQTASIWRRYFWR